MDFDEAYYLAEDFLTAVQHGEDNSSLLPLAQALCPDVTECDGGLHAEFNHNRALCATLQADRRWPIGCAASLAAFALLRQYPQSYNLRWILSGKISPSSNECLVTATDYPTLHSPTPTASLADRAMILGLPTYTEPTSLPPMDLREAIHLYFNLLNQL